MAEDKSTTSYWAVLIGINFYGKSQPNLKGAVWDVESINEYLKNSLTTVHVHTLKASAPSDLTSGTPAEEPNAWPTYENITLCLDRITSEGKLGDLVYIHFSGHGTRKQTTNQLALVLFGVQGPRYLYGSELAYRLNKMVKQGLIVTLVLDCCFSGSLVRSGIPTDSSVRAIEYDVAVDAAYPPKPFPDTELHAKADTLRDGHMLPNWMVNPDGYTVLVACGPDEIAKELQSKGGEWSGALSYFLVDALRPLGLKGIEISNQSLHQHLCVQFHVYWPQQNPMLFGNQNLSLFGKLRPAEKPFISVVREKNCFYLEAGHVHGVHENDEYAVYPPFPSETVPNGSPKVLSIVQVETVRSLTSDLRTIQLESDKTEVKTGWIARPRALASLHKVNVRLLAPVKDRSRWIAAAEQRRSLHLCTEDEEEAYCLFNVTSNVSNEYEILDALERRIIGLPAIPLDREQAPEFGLDVLDHLATFKNVEGIENRNPIASFVDSIKIYLSDETGQDVGKFGSVDVADGDILSLKVQNFNDQPRFLAILDLGPSWRIFNLISSDGGGDYRVVPAKGELEEIKWKMSVPDSFRAQNHTGCEDVIKVFVTSRPVSLTPLLLPKVPSFGDGSLRGDHDRYNQLLEFVLEVSMPFRGTGDEQWTTSNFIIRTHCKEAHV